MDKLQIKKNNKLLSTLYHNPKVAGSFSGYNSFKRAISENKINIKSQDIKDWLKTQDEYTLHKPLKKHFRRNQIIVGGIDDTWQADLIDVSNISKENNDFKYLLTCIDVFSKYAWVVPIKNKFSITIIKTFSTIFKKRKPKRLHTDQGTEFLNKECIKFLKEHNIKLYFLNSEMKASVVERFNRTLKEKLWRYFTWKKNKQYVHVLPNIVSTYNNTYHRSIKTKPSLVTQNNSNQIFFNLYGYQPKVINEDSSEINPRFKVGDRVRISKYKKIFEKGYTPNWTREIFIIEKIIYKTYPVYTIKDLNNETIKGVFYESELQKVI